MLTPGGESWRWWIWRDASSSDPSATSCGSSPVLHLECGPVGSSLDVVEFELSSRMGLESLTEQGIPRSTVQERLGLNRSARGGQAGMLRCKQWRPKKAKLERNGDEMQAAFLDLRLSFYTDRAPNPCWIVWNLNSRLIGISKMYDPSSEHVTRIFRLLCNVWRTLRVFWLCFSKISLVL